MRKAVPLRGAREDVEDARGAGFAPLSRHVGEKREAFCQWESRQKKSGAK